MANKPVFLGNKKRKQVSRLIVAKLEAMGLRDEITYRPSGKKVRVYFNRGKAVKLTAEQAELVVKMGTETLDLDDKGQLRFEEYDVPQAFNVLRGMVRTLRRQPLSNIQAFLTLDANAVKEPVPTEAAVAIETGNG